MYLNTSITKTPFKLYHTQSGEVDNRFVVVLVAGRRKVINERRSLRKINIIVSFFFFSKNGVFICIKKKKNF